MALVFLGLGTNLGNKVLNLNRAIQLIQIEIGEVLNASSFFDSKSWGFDSENEFLNAAVLIASQFTPMEILEKAKKIERKMGRTPKTEKTYQDRVIDIDILLYNNQIVNLPDLQIPHPLLHLRTFVLSPLVELAPDLIHPVLNETMTSLLCKLRNCNEINCPFHLFFSRFTAL